MDFFLKSLVKMHMVEYFSIMRCNAINHLTLLLELILTLNVMRPSQYILLDCFLVAAHILVAPPYIEVAMWHFSVFDAPPCIVVAMWHLFFATYKLCAATLRRKLAPKHNMCAATLGRKLAAIYISHALD